MNFLTAVKNHRERERSVGLRVTGSEIGRVASDARRGEDLMTKAVQKITLSPLAGSPFRQAGAEPVQRAAHQGWRVRRGTGQRHRPPRSVAEPERVARLG